VIEDLDLFLNDGDAPDGKPRDRRIGRPPFSTPVEHVVHRRDDLIGAYRIFPTPVAFETRDFANRPC
jgi:hypothetical protein